MGEDLGHAFLIVSGPITYKTHVLGFIHHILIFWKNIELISFIIKKYGEETPKTCFFECFRAWKARKCMSQVYTHHNSIKKNNI